MKKIGFICGAWDLLHPGHVYTLKECKKCCDHLIVGLHIDPSIERMKKHKPIQTVFERFVQLKGCKYVDEIIPYETEEDLLNILKTYEIDIRFEGTDYLPITLQEKVTGKDLVPIQYIQRNHSWSSSELRNRIECT